MKKRNMNYVCLGKWTKPNKIQVRFRVEGIIRNRDWDTMRIICFLIDVGK